MPWQDSSPDMFLKDFQDSKKLKPPSIVPAVDPFLPGDDYLNNKQSALSERSGGSTYVCDYGHSQSDRWSLSPLQDGLRDLSLLKGISGAADGEPGLVNCLCDALVPYHQENLKESKAWVPLGKLSEFCQRSNIFSELEKCFSEPDLSVFVDYVCGNPHEDLRSRHSARKIFAILVLIGSPDKLRFFFENGYSDRDLPFRKKDGILWPRQRTSAGNQRDNHGTCFHKEDEGFIRNFCREQWQVHIPYISRTEHDQVPEYQLHRETTMPWKSCEIVQVESGYANVYKVEIHPDHHAFGNQTMFALKVLHSTKQKDFQQELYALRKTPPGPHVIELLATFKRGDELSFLFPWAEGGNLSELMSKHPSKLLDSNPRASATLTTWLAEQCAGIANGLHRMHDVEPQFRNGDDSNKERVKRNYGIHGDVKPENILLFKGEGLGELKLSDFGLAKFHSMVSRSNQPGGGPMSPTYASPEQTGKWLTISRKSDVWALGCVFSMLLTWAIRGPEALKAYEDARHDEREPGLHENWHRDTFYGLNRTDGCPSLPDGFFLKKAVTDCINENKKAILEPDRESNYLSEFLDFIHDRMLKVDIKKRATSKEVCEFLDKTMRKYEGSNSSIRLPTLKGL